MRLPLLLFACLALGCSPGPGASNPPATAGATALAEATPLPPGSTIGEGDTVLGAGTYRLDIAKATSIADGESRYPAVQFTVPEGWNSHGGWVIFRGTDAPTIAVQFWNVSQVYRHPCQWTGTEFLPGRTVDDLVAALVAVPLRHATQPIDVSLAGYSGKYLEWSVPADFDFSTCDLDGTYHDFESWRGPPGDGDRYQQGPGQVDRLWILDIHGDRLVIDAFDMPIATAAERQQLLDVVHSISFE
jgi:hypothetical protein